MKRNVSIKLTVDRDRPNKQGLLSVKIRIKINNTKREQKTGVEVKPEDWHFEQGQFKTKSVSKYAESNKYLREIGDRIDSVKTSLLKGLISVDTAFDELMGRNLKEGSILDFVKAYKPDGITKGQTISKHITNIRAIESRLLRDGNKSLVPITFDHLRDLNVIEKLSKSITTAQLKQNTMASYQKSLNWVATKAKLPNPKPITSAGLLISEKATRKNQPIDSNSLVLGFNQINTIHQFEALLFWLYSFCLCGLDGIDICRLDEKKIITEGFTGDLSDFIPEADVLGRKDLAKPLHVHLNRSKTRRQGTDSGVDAVFLINLFPTLQIHKLLKNVMAHQLYAYKGKDKLRLFNFDIETPEGLKKWVDLRTSYRQAIADRVGTTTQRARHTITYEGGKIGVSRDKLDELLNHKINDVMAHYKDKSQLEADIAHTHILQNYSILKVFGDLIEMFKDRTSIVEDKVVRWIPEDMLDSTNYSRKKKNTPLYIHQTLKLGYLTSFTREEEVRYQTLMQEAAKGIVVIKDGKAVETEPDESKYPKELKDLIEKRTSKYFNPKKEIKPVSMEWVDPNAEPKPASKVIHLKSS